MANKYLRLFQTDTEFRNQYSGAGYYEPWVSYTEETQAVAYNKRYDDYLHFEVTSPGEIRYSTNGGSYYSRTIEYSINKGPWTSISADDAETINVGAGDVVYFKGDNGCYSMFYECLTCSTRYASYCNTFSGTTCGFKLKGNIMSLMSSENFKEMTTFPTVSPIEDIGSMIYVYFHPFVGLFMDCTGLTDASDLLLPAINSSTANSDWYSFMFAGCTSLEKAPKLPATTLPLATDASGKTYTAMFSGCTSLRYVNCQIAQDSQIPNTYNWLAGVSPTGTFVAHDANVPWTRDESGIPPGWTVEYEN